MEGETNYRSGPAATKTWSVVLYKHSTSSSEEEVTECIYSSPNNDFHVGQMCLSVKHANIQTSTIEYRAEIKWNLTDHGKLQAWWMWERGNIIM